MEHTEKQDLALKQVLVATLGQFTVHLEDRQLADTAWGREKARQLFQYFITFPHRHTTKERITGELWPELDAIRADRDFKVALNTLQGILEPDRPSRAPSDYISKQGVSYGLNPHAPVYIDAVEFEDGINAGAMSERSFKSQAIELYRKALHLYHGEYLPDTIYDDWSSAKRERLATLFLGGATRLARLLVEEGETVEAIDWGQRVIAADPCWEEAYRLLMRAHMASGNRPLAVRTYKQCQRSLANELGLEPMHETTQLFHKIERGETI